MRPSHVTLWMSFVLAATSLPAAKVKAQDDSTFDAASVCVIASDFQDEDPVVGWSYDADGNVLDEVWVQTMEAGGISYQLTGRLSFAGHRVDWAQEAEPAGEVETIFLPLSIPGEAFASDIQSIYVSDLVVHVLAVDSAGEVVGRRRLARIKVTWPEGPGTPELMDEEMAATAAPSGVSDADALADALAATGESADNNATFGPLAVVVPAELPPATVEDTP